MDDATLLEQLDEYLDETVAIPNDPDTILHVDFIGTGSEEGIANRDRFLPKSP